MAVYRTVSPKFWTDTKVVDMFTPEDKYFMLYLLTNPHANLIGCYEVSIKQISDETGYSRDSIYNLIARFKNQYNIIDYSETDKEILIKNWYKYNWTRSPKTKVAICTVAKGIKCKKFQTYIADIIKIKFEDDTVNSKQNTVLTESSIQNTDVCIGYGYGIDRVSGEQNAQKAPSQLCGVYQNVWLTEDELKQLKSAYSDWESKIDRLSTYIKQTGKRYESHYAVITAWAEEDAKKNPEKVGSFETDDFYRTALTRTYGEEGGEGV